MREETLMIEVTVTLYPQGRRDQPRELGRAQISNDGSGTKSRGNYNAYFTHEGKRWKESQVQGFHRQSRNAWYLLFECLKQAVGGL